MDAVADAWAGSLSELWARELHAAVFLAWSSVGVAVLLAVSVVVSGASWWASIAVGGVAASFALAHRRARRRGGPDLQ
ncbi:hypothetical protein [Klenkia taihuensis]|uniref:hypothetical protein n=1 Tax=Klenkia taihuensis TaxID=1225127 RepID=UPI0013F66ABD|nr:hypothetical protein [Klenkia taihuensis]GHE14607.1 hypothetical protein GCM10011381_41880 [Klenkia taihuensis]